MRIEIVILSLILVALAGIGTGYFVGTQMTTTVTAFLPGSCPVPSHTAPIDFGDGAGYGFLVEISGQGPWNATVQSYSAIAIAPNNLQATCYYGGIGTEYVRVAPWNSNGEETVVVTAHKMNSGAGNFTASVSYGVGVHSNSTVAPYGTVTTFMSAIP